jgi:hypothetical protein
MAVGRNGTLCSSCIERMASSRVWCLDILSPLSKPWRRQEFFEAICEQQVVIGVPFPSPPVGNSVTMICRHSSC